MCMLQHLLYWAYEYYLDISNSSKKILPITFEFTSYCFDYFVGSTL